jgi:hypothetical protein
VDVVAVIGHERKKLRSSRQQTCGSDRGRARNRQSARSPRSKRSAKPSWRLRRRCCHCSAALGALGAIRAQGVCFRQQLIRPISRAANRATHGARRLANPLTLFVRCPRTLSVVQQRISALRGDRRAVARGTQVLAPRLSATGAYGQSRAGDTFRLRLAGKDRKLIRACSAKFERWLVHAQRANAQREPSISMSPLHQKRGIAHGSRCHRLSAFEAS